MKNNMLSEKKNIINLDIKRAFEAVKTIKNFQNIKNECFNSLYCRFYLNIKN